MSMCSKNMLKFNHLLRRSGSVIGIKGLRCCCTETVTGQGQRNKLNIEVEGKEDRQGSTNRGRTHGRASQHYLAAAGVGLTLSAYLYWQRLGKVYAAEEDEEETHRDVAIDELGAEEGGQMPVGSKETGDSSGNAKEEVDWSKVPDYPSHVPYLLIGGGVASLEAYKAIRTKDPTAKVLMISEEDYPPYMRPPLSKNFWFDEDPLAYRSYEYTNVFGKKRSVFLSAGLYMEAKKLPFSENGGLGYIQNMKVLNLDSVNKTVLLENGVQIAFDKCLIATGGRPRHVSVLTRACQDVKERITLFRNLKDAWRLLEVLDTAKSVAVIGGGFLGSELSVGLAYKGAENKCQVYQIFPEKGNMAKVLPEYLSQYTTDQIKEYGVTVVPNANVTSAVFENGKVKLKLSNSQTVSVDHVVVAVGVEPNTELARSGALELDKQHGGFLVNSELQAKSDIYAAGDCACFYDPHLGRRRVEHHDHAYITGRLAGFNMAGDAQSYRHQSMFWSTVGMLSYEAVGMVDSSLDTCSVFRRKTDEETSEKKEDKTSKNERHFNEGDYGNGVIFYLKDGRVVGVVLWNLEGFQGEPTRIDIARQVIADGAKEKDLKEVAKLFNVYAD
ncbi:apoptosis-inducing factor 1, mitochondrial-like [Mya arenaria]|uniref:apoptosis-inducing factor 1, mitochondrial-like n=1 Tax=Mya arenaria TaxID=6604 RepID=UPI0022E38F28|nr:apoptosis-inducing factor 1, mitochondrial-like [Mya arenaria]